MQAIEPQLVRAWVHEVLSKPLPKHLPQLQHVLSEVYNRACQENYVDPRLIGPGIPASPSLTDIPEDLQNAIREVIWSLIIQGIIVPGIPNEVGGSGLPSFTITECGKRCLSEKEYLPHDALRYIEKLKAEIVGVHADIVLYIR